MRRYETIVIVHPDLPDDELLLLMDRYRAIVAERQGRVVRVEKWGKKKLAYEIRKQHRGVYFLLDYAGNSAVVDELERNLKIEDRVLKFLTVRKADVENVEELEKEIAAGEAEAAPEPAAEAAPAEPPVPETNGGNQ